MNPSAISQLIEVFQANLIRLETEVDSFDERFLWAVNPGISNSGGNLALHLVGNLNHFIGAIIGKTDYHRNRENEFGASGVPKRELIQMIGETSKMLQATLTDLSEDYLAAEYPIIVFGKPMSVQYFLFHLSAHLSYHLGQINYLRRILQNSSIGG